MADHPRRHGPRVVDGGVCFSLCLRLYSLEFAHAWKMFLMLRSFRAGEHGALTEVLTLDGKDFKINTRHSRLVNADGEIVTRTPATFRVLPKAIDVVVPG